MSSIIIPSLLINTYPRPDMNTRLYLFFIVLLHMTMPDAVRAQATRADSLRLQLHADSAHIYRHKKVHMLLSLDQRNSFLETTDNSNTPVDINGIKLGVVMNDRHKTGIGIYSIRDRSRHISRRMGEPADLDFSFRYITVFYEYLFIYSRHWDIGIPFEAGYGRYTAFGPTNPPPVPGSRNRDNVYPLGTALDVHFKLLRWFSVNGMGGYRHVINNTSPVNLSNWFYAIGLSINTRNLYQDGRYYLKKQKFKREMEQ